MTSGPDAVRDYVGLGIRYAEDVISGARTECLYIQLACEQFLRRIDAANGPEYFEPERAVRVCQFLELLPHVKGPWARRGDCLKLEPWMCFALTAIYTLVDDEGHRIIREVYWEVARKNAKTTTAGGLGLYHLFLDGESGAEVYCGATSQKQAFEVFGVARQMVKRKPELVEAFGADPRVSRILVEDTFSKFEPLIHDPGDGSSPSFYIADEYHEHGDAKQYNSMRSGMSAREQPLTLIITTAGENQAGPCYMRRRVHLEALQGSVQAPDLFTLIYTLDENDDWTDFDTNKKANPNLGVSVLEKQLRGQHAEALRSAERQNNYRTKQCNIWVGATSTFLNLANWNRAPERPPWEAMEGRRCFLGADLASKIDLAALVALFPPDDQVEFWCAYFWYWSCEANLQHRENTHLVIWRDAGLLYESPGERIDLDEIVDEIRDIRTQVEVAEMGYDPYHATQLATATGSEGLEAVEVSMSVKNLSPAMRELEALTNERQIAHGGDECTTWQAGNLQAFEDRKSNVFPRKETKAHKIDGMVALLLALFRATAPEEEPEESIYNTRGIRSV